MTIKDGLDTHSIKLQIYKYTYESYACHSVFYCSKEHQRMDWKLDTSNAHKEMCKQLQ